MTKAWKYGDDVDTDVIIPGKYLDDYDPSHLAAHAMEGIDPDFATKVSNGDVLVAGKNFGCGSSREQAPIALKYAGIRIIIAKSFARIFYRNAINQGIWLIESDAVDAISDGEDISVDPESGVVTLASGEAITFEPLPERLRAIILAGGLVEYLKLRG